MSESLRDVRSKVSAECWALLVARARATGRDPSEVMRDVLHGWSDGEWAVIRVAQRLLAVTGHDGADEGRLGTAESVRLPSAAWPKRQRRAHGHRGDHVAVHDDLQLLCQWFSRIRRAA